MGLVAAWQLVSARDLALGALQALAVEALKVAELALELVLVQLVEEVNLLLPHRNLLSVQAVIVHSRHRRLPNAQAEIVLNHHCHLPNVREETVHSRLPLPQPSVQGLSAPSRNLHASAAAESSHAMAPCAPRLIPATAATTTYTSVRAYATKVEAVPLAVVEVPVGKAPVQVPALGKAAMPLESARVPALGVLRLADREALQVAKVVDLVLESAKAVKEE